METQTRFGVTSDKGFRPEEKPVFAIGFWTGLRNFERTMYYEIRLSKIIGDEWGY